MKLSFESVAREPMAALLVKVAESTAELAWCRSVLEVEHGLGAGRPAGRQLWQIVCRGTEPVGVVVWAAAAWHLKWRDDWIGWDAMKRSERLGLIVNNTRLLILEESREPNLATQLLGAALRALPGQWQQVHGYAPLLAEAFTDIETHHGTSYKASNWIALGQTAGFERHSADFYVRHGRPKKLWVYPLHPAAKKRLCAAQLAPEDRPAQIAPTVRCPLKLPQMRSLRDVLLAMDDPRRAQSRRYGLSVILTLICLGLLSGAHTVSDIVRSAQLLSQKERKALGLPRKKNSETFRVPCYNVFRELLPRLDLGQLLEILGGWLSQHEGILPRTLALDGKDLGNQLGLVVSLINTTHSASGEKPGLEHDATPAPPVAMAVAGKGCEQAAVQEILERPEVDLRGALVTADALHCQHATLHQIVAVKGGDYLISLKDNQPKAATYARAVLDGTAPLFVPITKPTGG